MYYVYLLKEVDGNRTYVGFTSDLTRRLSQHNGEMAGGAKSTRGRKWQIYAYIDGIEEMKRGLQLEWRIKHPWGRKKVSGIEKRMEAINYVLELPQFNEEKWKINIA